MTVRFRLMRETTAPHLSIVRMPTRTLTMNNASPSTTARNYSPSTRSRATTARSAAIVSCALALGLAISLIFAASDHSEVVEASDLPGARQVGTPLPVAERVVGDPNSTELESADEIPRALAATAVDVSPSSNAPLESAGEPPATTFALLRLLPHPTWTRRQLLRFPERGPVVKHQRPWMGPAQQIHQPRLPLPRGLQRLPPLLRKLPLPLRQFQRAQQLQRRQQLRRPRRQHDARRARGMGLATSPRRREPRFPCTTPRGRCW